MPFGGARVTSTFGTRGSRSSAERSGFATPGEPFTTTSAEVPEELRAAVLLHRDLQELRVRLDEGRVAAAGEEHRVARDVLEEGDVRLHPAYAELLERAVHDARRRAEREAPGA